MHAVQRDRLAASVPGRSSLRPMYCKQLVPCHEKLLHNEDHMHSKLPGSGTHICVVANCAQYNMANTALSFADRLAICVLKHSSLHDPAIGHLRHMPSTCRLLFSKLTDSKANCRALEVWLIHRVAYTQRKPILHAPDTRTPDGRLLHAGCSVSRLQTGRPQAKLWSSGPYRGLRATALRRALRS